MLQKRTQRKTYLSWWITVYSKAKENLRNIVKKYRRLATNAKDYQKLVSQPTLLSQKIFNKCGCVGVCISDLSKNLMYNFHYSYVRDRYGKKDLFTDTDSLTSAIKSSNAYEYFYRNKQMFDIQKIQRFNNVINKKVIDKIKIKLKTFQLLSLVDKNLICTHSKKKMKNQAKTQN